MTKKSRGKVPKSILGFILLCLAVTVTLWPETNAVRKSTQLQLKAKDDGNNKVLNTTLSLLVANGKSNDNKTEQKRTIASAKLFVCGFDLNNFKDFIFGDLEFAGRFGESTGIEPTSQDILLQGGTLGPCVLSPEEKFPGKILFVNSESRKDSDSAKHLRNERFFMLGPTAKESHRSMSIVSFGAIFFVSTTTNEQRQWILDPSKKKKPSNNDRHQQTSVRDAIVYVVHRCGTVRNEAAIELTESLNMTIHQNPKCPIRNKNFHPIPKQDWTKRDRYYENWKLYSKYRYCLVLENTATSKYITEKIFLAFLGGCIPIYWGTRDIFNIFNPKSFVFYDLDNPDKALREIQRLETNQTAYKEKLDEPILAHGEKTVEEYLSLADDIGNGRLKYKIRAMMGLE